MTPPVRAVNPPGDALSQEQPSLLAVRGRDGRSMSSTATSAMAGSRGPQSYATANPAPGSFSSQLRPTQSHEGRLQPSFDMHAITVGAGDDGGTTTEKRQADLQDQIDKETKIKVGSENLLEALTVKNTKKDQRQEVERQLSLSNGKLAQLKQALALEQQRAKEIKSPPPDAQSRLSYLFRHNLSRSPSRHITEKEGHEDDEETESPTFVLAEILQALEIAGMQPEYYVTKANSLVDLFKRHSTLKFDLAWSIFGLRMQTLLLSDNREMVAAAYRVMRYAITDRKSLQTIRALHTDYLVILSLVKETKTSVEREQALKFIRAFLDVKDGVEEISRAIVRILVAVAEHTDDRLRNIAMLTLSELLVRKPALVVAAGGMGTLTDAMGEGNYLAAQSICHSFLYLLDTPRRRTYLKSGYELDSPFATFTDAGNPHGQSHEEKRLRQSADVIASLMRSWTGLLTLCMNDFLPIRSLLLSLQIEAPHVRTIILELLSDILMIKAPSWSSSFLAGRRLTTYGRVTNLKNAPNKSAFDSSAKNETNKWNLLEHYVAAVLAVFLHAGLVPALLLAEEQPLTLALKRKTTLLLGEILKMANELLPPTWSSSLQVLPQLFHSAASWGNENRFVAIGTIYQVDSVNRTLYRSGPTSYHPGKAITGVDTSVTARQTDTKAQAAMLMDEGQFRNIMLETGVLSTVNFTKWRWDLIQNIIDGPLLNAKRLDEAIKATKFIHRLLGFYRPFKWRFSEIKNTKPNQRYVRVGSALINCLLQNPDGVKYLSDSKFIRQVAECLSHFDRMSGLTSESPIFQVNRMNETLTSGYFALLGELSKDVKGVQILERWRVLNMFYHMIELGDRDDLIRVLLSNMDYTLDGHLRIIITKAMTSCSKDIRIFSTRLLRKYATRPMQTTESTAGGVAEWAIKLLVTQLYDPEVEVCEVAIKILEEACNQTQSLEYVVKCRPALDHLGEIGAPLLLRFLSTSVGYHYLDELDYITREMDDWFLGRNDSYVALIEASMARAFAELTEKPPPQLPHDDVPEHVEYGIVPPHFYRELTRTKEGCKLLERKGHFDEFVSTIRDCAMEDDDAETILKVKGCLWAVGNVGSMELGAPFLENSDVVKWIVQIAETSQVMSLRGTAFYVLGLISRSLHGQEILVEFGWDGVVNEYGEALGFCLPLDFKKLFSMTPWVAKSDDVRWKSTGDVKIAVTDSDAVNARILKLATDLGNTVLAKKAANDLQAIKVKKAPGFTKPAMFHKVMQILEAHHFRLPACRFALDLFDRRVLRQIVLDEEDEEEEEGKDDDDDGSSSDSSSDPPSEMGQSSTNGAVKT